jgi:chorismate dehydratase
MNLTVGFIPYLNMVPFHQGFGPGPFQEGEFTVEFRKLSPRALGIEAESGKLDAGAMSLVDLFRLSEKYEPLGPYGIGVKKVAGSVLLFSKVPLDQFEGLCAVTDETSTSVRLLQVLLEKRYSRTGITYGRVASSLLYDGSANGLLLIGDEALRARKEGIKGLPVVTDLATEWMNWQGAPFVFARWAVAKQVPERSKMQLITIEAKARGLATVDVGDYWDGFVFRLTPEHERSIRTFKGLVEQMCLTA